jgi:hypothetical protein
METKKDVSEMNVKEYSKHCTESTRVLLERYTIDSNLIVEKITNSEKPFSNQDLFDALNSI